MFNKRTLYFNKKWINVDKDRYNTISDGSLYQAIIEKANYYKLSIKKIYFSELYPCKIIVRGDKQLFLNFVDDLVDKIGKYIEKMNFKF